MNFLKKIFFINYFWEKLPDRFGRIQFILKSFKYLVIFPLIFMTAFQMVGSFAGAFLGVVGIAIASVAAIYSFVLQIVFTINYYRVMIRRLHDLNVSGAMIIYFAALLLILTIASIIFAKQYAYILGLILIALAGAIIALNLVPGSKTSNKYGPPNSAPQSKLRVALASIIVAVKIAFIGGLIFGSSFLFSKVTDMIANGNVTIG